MAKSETFIPGKTVIQEQDPDVATLDEGTGAILYDPDSFNLYTKASPLTTEVGKRRTMEPFILAWELPDAVNLGTTLLWTLPWKVRIIDAWTVATAAGDQADTAVTLKNAANTIGTITIANTGDKVVDFIATIDDAYYEIDATGTLNAVSTGTDESQCGCWLYVKMARVV